VHEPGLTKFPGTALFEGLRSEGRITALDWSRYSGRKDVAFIPKNMSPEELQDGFERANWLGGRRIVLSLGASPKNHKKPAKEVGETIVRVCRDEGLAVDWNGDPGQRIEVLLDWKRRR
jgi:hypothetical protein